MPVLSPKRQVTLPKELCDRLSVVPGDQIDIVEYNGRITILRQVQGRSAGVLKHLKGDKRYSEAESRDSAIASKRRRSAANPGLRSGRSA